MLLSMAGNSFPLRSFGAPKEPKDHLPPSAAKSPSRVVNAERFLYTLNAEV